MNHLQSPSRPRSSRSRARDRQPRVRRRLQRSGLPGVHFPRAVIGDGASRGACPGGCV